MKISIHPPIYPSVCLSIYLFTPSYFSFQLIAPVVSPSFSSLAVDDPAPLGPVSCAVEGAVRWSACWLSCLEEMAASIFWLTLDQNEATSWSTWAGEKSSSSSSSSREESLSPLSLLLPVFEGGAAAELLQERISNFTIFIFGILLRGRFCGRSRTGGREEGGNSPAAKVLGLSLGCGSLMLRS